MYQFAMYFPNGFEQARARETAFLCRQAYALFKQKPAPAKYEIAGYEDVSVFYGGFKVTSLAELAVLFAAAIRLHARVSGHELFGFVARRGHDVFVVFRGTDSLLGWPGDIHM